MEQLRQIGEGVGSLKALMVFRDDIHINQRQCILLLDMFSLAYETIAGEMRQALKFEEKDTKWKVLEQPLRELHRVLREGESYIRHSLETKDWWAKAITLHQDKSCVEFHIHNLLCCVYIVIEAIESAGEIAGLDHEEMQKKKAMYSIKYQRDFKDPKIFEWRFGKQYLVSQDLCNRISSVWVEDRWILLNKIGEKRNSSSTKHERRLADLLLKYLDVSQPSNNMLLPSSTLVGSRDYQVRRRLGSGSQYKEIQWLGESFAMRHFFGEIEPLLPHISKHISLSHPNILTILCGFVDDELKECFLVMELMNRDLSSYIKEVSGPRKRIPLSPPIAVDVMLQIARGMEYLHSKKVYHGDLNSSNILIKPRNNSSEGYLLAKVSGYDQSLPVHLRKTSLKQNDTLPFIWHAPEVIAEEEQLKTNGTARYTEKSDVYSFGMICFELLTGKVPFEDFHLQGDKMTRNIRSGERPLFPFSTPKYLTSLTKKCWHEDPNQRPSFSSICRILRYINRFLVMNPNHDQANQPMPVVDYCEIEGGLLRNFSAWGNSGPLPVSQIPFQMFAYTLGEKEKTSTSLGESSESGTDGTSTCGEESIDADDSCSSTNGKTPPLSPQPIKKKHLPLNQSSDIKPHKQPGTPKKRPAWTPPISPRGRITRINSESQIKARSPRH